MVPPAMMVANDPPTMPVTEPRINGALPS